MAFYEVYSHPALVRYKTSVCTKATLFLVVVLCLTYIAPLLVAYRSQGFWIKRSTYEEQPTVRFQYQVLLVAATSSRGNYVAWSTFPHLNNMLGANLRIPAISVREEDQNQDGKLDLLNFQLQLPLKPRNRCTASSCCSPSATSSLYRMSTVVMQSLAYVQHSSSVPGAKLFISGDLRLKQRAPLPHRGLYNIYNVSVIDGSSPFASAYDLGSIIRSYQSRNLTTVLSCPMPVWIYVSVLLIFLWVFERIQRFVFQNQVLTTVPIPVAKPHLSFLRRPRPTGGTTGSCHARCISSFSAV
ncbi:hypothetical protein INR49_025086 [Caranx melampygus]|nr:hypothetical protein INR49_025086 [Caranx melampygus]